MTPTDRLASLLTTPAMRAARRILSPPAHLVGGCLRDVLLGRSCRDLDLVVDGDRREEIARLAEVLAARLVDLSSGRFPTLRLVLGDSEIDVWRRGDVPLADELARRDLTINAIAWDLHEERFVDPCDGLRDLERRRLRAPRQGVFAEDPLRTLRLARFGAQLPQFDLESRTLDAARRAVPDLPTVASERIREELATLWRQDDARRGLEIAAEIGLYPRLWEEPRQEQEEDPRRAGARATATLERLDDAVSVVRRHLATPAVDLPLARLAATVRALLDPEAARRHLRDRGYVSRDTDRRLRPLVAETRLPVDELERRRFLHRSGELWPTTAAVLLAERGGAALNDGTLVSLARLWSAHGEEIADPPRLVSGDEVAEILDLEPGPALGEVIERLRRLQIDGVLTDREQALERLRSWSVDAPFAASDPHQS